MKSKTVTAMEWLRANTAGHTLQMLVPIIERAREEGRQEATDNAQADAIRVLHPFVAENAIMAIRLSGHKLVMDFLRHKLAEAEGKLTEAKEIISDFRSDHNKFTDGGSCARCQAEIRAKRFLGAAA